MLQFRSSPKREEAPGITEANADVVMASEIPAQPTALSDPTTITAHGLELAESAQHMSKTDKLTDKLNSELEAEGTHLRIGSYIVDDLGRVAFIVGKLPNAWFAPREDGSRTQRLFTVPINLDPTMRLAAPSSKKIGKYERAGIDLDKINPAVQGRLDTLPLLDADLFERMLEEQLNKTKQQKLPKGSYAQTPLIKALREEILAHLPSELAILHGAPVANAQLGTSSEETPVAAESIVVSAESLSHDAIETRSEEPAASTDDTSDHSVLQLLSKEDTEYIDTVAKRDLTQQEQKLNQARLEFAKLVHTNRSSVRKAFGNTAQRAKIKLEQTEALKNWLEARGEFVETKAASKSAAGIDVTTATGEILLETYADDLAALKEAAMDDTSIDAKLVKWFSRGTVVTKAVASAAIEDVSELGIKRGLVGTVASAQSIAKSAIKHSDEKNATEGFLAYASENPEDHEKRLANDRPRLRAKVLKGAAIAAVATAVIYKHTR